MGKRTKSAGDQIFFSHYIYIYICILFTIVFNVWKRASQKFLKMSPLMFHGRKSHAYIKHHIKLMEISVQHVVCYVGYRDSILHVYTSREWWPCVCVCVCPSASSCPAPFTVHAQPQWGTHGSCLEPLMTGLILKSHRVPPLPRFSFKLLEQNRQTQSTSKFPFGEEKTKQID